MNRVDYRGSFWFPVPPEELWRTVQRFDRFESWWAWLGEFHADGDRLAAGTVLHGVVMPPVPYRLRLDVRLDECAAPTAITATVDGDVHGQATLRLEPAGSGTLVEVAWWLDMVSRPLRIAATVAYPLMRWGHDRVVEMTVAGFRRRALTGG